MNIEILSARIKGLNDSTDNLNDVFGDAEKAINSIKPGVSAEVVIWNNEKEFYKKKGGVRVFQYRKLDNSWQLCIATVFPDYEENIANVTSGSRAERIRCANMIRELFEKITEEIQNQTKDVNCAAIKLVNFTEEIRSAKPF